MAETTDPQSETVDTAVAHDEPQQTPETPRKYKVKVDGLESEVDETELINSYQKGRSADKRFQEASDLRKQLETFVENAKADPTQLLEQLGHNPKDWARNLLIAEIELEEQEKDPNLKRIAGLEKKLNELEKGEQSKKQLELAKIAEAEETALVAKIDNEIGKTLEEMGFLAGSAPAELIADIAEQMLAEYKLSKTSIDSKEALARTKQSYSRRLSAISKNKPEAILDLIPSEYLDKIAEAYMKKRQPKVVPALKSPTPAIVQTKDQALQKELEDFFKRKS